MVGQDQAPELHSGVWRWGLAGHGHKEKKDKTREG